MKRRAAFGLLAAGVAACAPVPTKPPPPAIYRALGQEPGWSLEISGRTMVYLGDYGTVRIVTPRPEPRPTFNGHRYEASAGGHSLVVDVTHSLCHDGMSGRAFADTVMLIADGRTVHGCGGNRLPARDM